MRYKLQNELQLLHPVSRHNKFGHVCRLGISYTPSTLIPSSCQGSQTWPPLTPSTKLARCTMRIPQQPLSTLRMRSTWPGCRERPMGEDPNQSSALHMTSPQCQSSTAPALPSVTNTGLPGLLRLCYVIHLQQWHHRASYQDALCRQC